ncbi:MAG: hypothetical protein AAF196_19970 [Planctomycetota bacterium]
MINRTPIQGPLTLQAIADGEEDFGTALEPESAVELELRRAIGADTRALLGQRPLHPLHRASAPLLGAVAAIAVVALVATFSNSAPDPDSTPAGGRRFLVSDLGLQLALQVDAEAVSHPFELVPLHFELESKSDRRFVFLPRELCAISPERAADFFVEMGPRGAIPVRLTFEVTDTDGSLYSSPRGREFESGDGDTVRRLLSASASRFEMFWPPLVASEGPLDWSSRYESPIMEGESAREYRMPGEPEVDDGSAGTEYFRPSGNGVVRTTVRVEGLPVTEGAWWVDVPDLTLSFGVEVDAVFGEWSEPVEGLRARIVAAPSMPGDGRVPLALELENLTQKTMHYNFVGRSAVRIPQPQHFEFVLDGEPLRQHGQLPIRIRDELCLAPHAAGLRRTLGAILSDWQLPSDLSQRGSVELGAFFEFRALTRGSPDSGGWTGRVEAPSIRVRVDD